MSTKWCRFQAGGKTSYGRIDGDSVVAVDGAPWGAPTVTSSRHALASVKLLIPTVPSTFFCVGINYRDHIIQAAKRRGVEPQFPERPDIGYRANNALTAHESPIVKPKDSGEVFQYEGELVAVIGRKAKHLSEDEALGCVLGYTLGNDVSERTWQRGDRTLWRAKNTDTFKPMGPTITTDLDPMARSIAVRINGQTVSEYDTKAMLFSVQRYIATMSRYLTLWPGDVVWFGCDNATEPALKPGDVVEVVDDAIGVLKNRVVRES